MTPSKRESDKKPYERPEVARVVIDLLQEMLSACDTAQGGKTDAGQPGAICSTPGS